MEKHLENYLWNEMEKNGHGFPFPNDVIMDMFSKGMIKNPKQAYRTLEKWTKNKKYDYGCSLLFGWKIKN